MAKLYVGPPHVLEEKQRARGPLYHLHLTESGGARTSTADVAAKNVIFVCLFAGLSRLIVLSHWPHVATQVADTFSC